MELRPYGTLAGLGGPGPRGLLGGGDLSVMRLHSEAVPKTPQSADASYCRSSVLVISRDESRRRPVICRMVAARKVSQFSKSSSASKAWTSFTVLGVLATRCQGFESRGSLVAFFSSILFEKYIFPVARQKYPAPQWNAAKHQMKRFSPAGLLL